MVNIPLISEVGGVVKNKDHFEVPKIISESDDKRPWRRNADDLVFEE